MGEVISSVTRVPFVNDASASDSNSIFRVSITIPRGNNPETTIV